MQEIIKIIKRTEKQTKKQQKQIQIQKNLKKLQLVISEQANEVLHLNRSSYRIF